ncbi:MAG: hypothetical protein KDJ80_15800 [Nitratireductor sp.]|nr:hypothetical protein [Nitratireductor sp.]
MIDTFREIAYGLKLGMRHCVSSRHNMAEKALRPSVSATLKNGKVGSESAGR